MIPILARILVALVPEGLIRALRGQRGRGRR